ncbi:MAG: hypothetical protein H6603_01875 [Flavobacteriales bacterium]|nr:hypothetical protein [Flavobacteriales bacterium]MCB9203699.1 hypothetical protein [Flavobacteriales bacterium]
MSSRPALLIILLFSILVFGLGSCDLINPDEKIPGFICIDSISLNPGNGRGTDMHNIVDAWVYDNEQLVGVYELPAVVPILTTGDANIRIRGGIKVNGQAASRLALPFFEDYVGTVEIFEDSTICINPTLTFKSSVTTPWVEDFEVASQVSMSSTNLSQENVAIVSGAEAFDGKSAKLSLPAGQDIFECKSNGSFDLPSAGATVILEFSYKCNHPFVVSLFSGNSNGTVQTPILLVSESAEWNHIYVSLTQTVSTIFSANEHEPAFGFVRNDGMDGEINVYLDNIRLTHFE